MTSALLTLTTSALEKYSSKYYKINFFTTRFLQLFFYILFLCVHIKYNVNITVKSLHSSRNISNHAHLMIFLYLRHLFPFFITSSLRFIHFSYKHTHTPTHALGHSFYILKFALFLSFGAIQRFVCPDDPKFLSSPSTNDQRPTTSSPNSCGDTSTCADSAAAAAVTDQVKY